MEAKKNKMEGINDYEMPKSQDMELDELNELLEILKTSEFNAIYTAYKYGFIKGTAYKNKKRG